jgi:hypothetical protein
MSKKLFVKWFFLGFFIISCSKNDEILLDKIVYQNDFESNIDNNISNATFTKYNNSTVLGDFNNSGFRLNLENLEQHNKILISFDLYIHGSWDGNFNRFVDKDKPDLWKMELGISDTYYNNHVFETTFSNSPCASTYCLRQSYPNNYPHSNNPKTGYHQVNLSPICTDEFGGPTTLYKFEKVLNHKDSTAIFSFYDQLYQPNAFKNGVNYTKCDESWSIDNLTVRILYQK